VASIKVGHGLEDGTGVGALTTSQGVKRAVTLVEDAVKNGAKVEAGGKRSGKGWAFEPTILSGAGKSSRVAQEELFAPILSIYSFETEAEVRLIRNLCSHTRLSREPMIPSLVSLPTCLPKTSLAHGAALKISSRVKSRSMLEMGRQPKCLSEESRTVAGERKVVLDTVSKSSYKSGLLLSCYDGLVYVIPPATNDVLACKRPLRLLENRIWVLR